MVKYDQLVSKIYPYVSACPDIIIEQAIGYVVGDFFKESRLWVEIVPFQVKPDCITYVIPPLGEDTYVEEVDRIYRLDANGKPDGELVKVTHRSQLPKSGNRVLAYTATKPDQILVGPETTNPETLLAETILVPTSKADSIPEDLFESYSPAIQHGVIAYLKEQSGHPWYDPDGAKYHQGKYRAKLSDAIIRRRRGQVNASERVITGDWT